MDITPKDIRRNRLEFDYNYLEIQNEQTMRELQWILSQLLKDWERAKAANLQSVIDEMKARAEDI
jgi:hypothetical protein